MSAPRLLAPTTISGGVPTAGAGTLNTIALWTPDGNTLGNSLLTQAGNVTTNSGTFRTADGSSTEPGYTFTNSSGSGMYRGASGTVLRFASSGTFAFGVTSAQNVLIGGSATVAPAARLQVVGTANNNVAYLIGSATVGQSFGAVIEAGTNASDRSFAVYNSGLTSPYLFVRGDGNVGFGTASPGDRLQIGAPTGTAPFGIIIGENYGAASQRARLAFGDANRGIGLTSGDNVLIHTFNTNSILFGHGSTTSFTERARIDSAGNFAVGRVPTAGTIFETQGDQVTFRDAAGNVRFRFEAANSLVNVSIGAGWGLKLPATPGNADTQTLDCYQEGTWVPTLTGFGGTNPTLTARYTRIGRIVVVQVVIVATGGNQFSSTAATTYISLPAGMTPVFDSPGSTSSSAIAADGACVAYSNGNLYLPTFALRTATTMLNVTYTV